MFLENKKNYSCHCHKPYYFVRVIQDFCCQPRYWEEFKQEENKCDEMHMKRENSSNDWEQEFEARYWNDKCFKDRDNERNKNCCHRNY